MQLDYTEFSFGYAFTENLIRSASSRPRGAPFFPNLLQEAQLGYDVRIDLPGCPLYLQFKLPELMVRNSAMEISRNSLDIALPFFRMYLMKRNLSKQHKRLIELEEKSTDAVYYATPIMENVSDFNTAYNSATVHRQSIFFSPEDIGPLPDDEQHVIAYSDGLGYAWMCSKPNEVSVLQYENISEKLRNSFEDARYRTLEATAHNIREALLPLIPQQIRGSEGAIQQRIHGRRARLGNERNINDPTGRIVVELLVLREIARVGLGLELIIAQPPY